MIALTLSILTACGVVQPRSNSTAKGSIGLPLVTQTTIRGGGSVHLNPHIFVIMMENLSYSDALATPSLMAEAHRYAYDTEYFGVTHPSLPNYLAATAGTTFGITSDCLTCFVSSTNLADQLTSAGVSWGAYFGGVSSECYLGTSYGTYAAKHNPFRYFDDLRSSASSCANLHPLADLQLLLSQASSTLPDFVWVTPDICEDGHDCAAQQAGVWLSNEITQITSTTTWKEGGLILVAWDEGSGSDTASITPSGSVEPTGGGGHAFALVVSPLLAPSTVLSTPMNEYSILATLEHAYNLPYLGQAANYAPDVLDPLGNAP